MAKKCLRNSGSLAVPRFGRGPDTHTFTHPIDRGLLCASNAGLRSHVPHSSHLLGRVKVGVSAAFITAFFHCDQSSISLRSHAPVVGVPYFFHPTMRLMVLHNIFNRNYGSDCKPLRTNFLTTPFFDLIFANRITLRRTLITNRIHVQFANPAYPTMRIHF